MTSQPDLDSDPYCMNSLDPDPDLDPYWTQWGPRHTALSYASDIGWNTLSEYKLVRYSVLESRISDIRYRISSTSYPLSKKGPMWCPPISPTPLRLKPNSWTYDFVEVSGHNLESSQTWGFRILYSVYNKNQFQTTFARGGGGVQSVSGGDSE